MTATISVTVMSLYGAVSHAAGEHLREGRVRRMVDVTMGAVLVGFAGRLAVQARP